jgi:integrase
VPSFCGHKCVVGNFLRVRQYFEAMSRGSRIGKWNVHFHPTELQILRAAEALPDLSAVLLASSKRVRKPGRPFLIDPSGRADGTINDFFVEGDGSQLALTSASTYAYNIASFCNTLHSLGTRWDAATQRDIADVRTWRMDDPRNPRRVSDKTWQKQFTILSELYQWAETRGVKNPLSRRYKFGGGAYVASASVKWFTPRAFAQWRDVGLCGMLPSGLENSSFRGRSAQRDSAFASGLNWTGLRVQELGNLLLGLEWPDAAEQARRYITKKLPGGIAKGAAGRKYWIPAASVMETAAYVIGERARAVSIAQSRGSYLKVLDRLVVREVTPTHLRVETANGRSALHSFEKLSVDERQSLFWNRDGLLEPVTLWLTSDGMPHNHRNWNRVFDRANRRLEQLGLNYSRLTPHHLRHSFALRWYSVARILWMGRLSGLTEVAAADLRDEIGSEWGLVRTLLGHRNSETTKAIYLEPFQSLDVEILLEQVNDETVAELVEGLMSREPRVQGLINGESRW